MNKLDISKGIDPISLGTLVAYKRHYLKLTKEQLAIKVGSDLETIVLLEKGSLPLDLNLITKLFNVLNIEVIVDTNMTAKYDTDKGDMFFILFVSIAGFVLLLSIAVGLSKIF